MSWLDTVSNIVSPVANIATKTWFWIVIGAILFFALVIFILFPLFKGALIWAGRIVGTFMGMGG